MSGTIFLFPGQGSQQAGWPSISGSIPSPETHSPRRATLGWDVG